MPNFSNDVVTASGLQYVAKGIWDRTSAFLTSADLNDYASKQYVDTGLDEKQDTSAMSAYATSSWVEEQGYLTSEDLDDYATKEYVTSSTSAFVTSDDLEGILADYKTAAEVDDEFTDTSAWAEATFASATQLASYATIEDLNDGLDEKLDKTDSADFYTIDNPSGFITSEALEGYATEEYVQSQTSGLQPSGDYATKGWVEDQDYLTEVPDTYAESAWVAANFASAAQLSDYATSQDLEDGLADKLDKTASAEFYPMDTNPSGYLVNSDLSTYATQEYVQQETSGKVDAVEGKGLSTNDYTDADKDVVARTSAVIPASTTDQNKLVNEQGLNDAIADFGGFQKSTPDAQGKPTESDPSTRIIYLTHVDSAVGPDYYREWLWNSATSNWEMLGDTSLDLNGYATEDYVIEHTSGKLDKSTSGQFYLASNPARFIDSTALEPYALTSYVDAGLGNKLDTSATSAYAESAWVAANFQPVGDYATKQYVTDNTSAFITSSYLDHYAKTSELAAVSAEIMNEMPSIEGLAQEDWVKANFASAAQLSEKLDKTASADFYPANNPSGFLTSDDVAQSDWTEADSADPAYIKNKPAALSMAAGEGIQIVESNNTITFSVSGDYAERSDLDDYYPTTNPSGFLTEVPAEYVTDTELQTVLDDYGTSAWILDQLDEKVDKETDMGLSHEDFTSAYKDKLDHIEASANKNVQSDWTESDSASDAFIKNKPEHISLKGIDGIEITESNNNLYVGVSGDFATNDDLNYVSAHIPSLAGYATENYVQQQTSGKVDKVAGKALSTNDFTDAMKDKLDAIESSAQVNVQSDWTEIDTTSDAYIKNKPVPLSMAAGEGISIVEDNNTVTFSVSASYAAASALDYVSAGVDYVSGALNGYATTSDLQTGLASKVDTVPGKGLSTNDYDDAASAKLYGIQAGAEVNVQSDWGQIDTTADDFIKNKPTPISMAAGNGISITEANDTVTFAVTDAIATSAWVAANFASAAQLSDMATTQYVNAGLSSKLDKSESANYWPQATANEVIPAGTDASNQLVNELGLATAMADFGGFKKSTPDASGKPTESDPSTKIIYLTYVSSAASPDKYNEWIWDSAGNDYELIGDTTLDLTGYATETYVDQHTSGKIDWASSGRFYLATNPDHFVTSGEIATLSAKIEGDIPSITGLAAETWVQANFASASQISDMATQTWVGQQDFATNDDVDFVSGGVDYVSAALAGYATTSDLNNKVDKVAGKGLSTNDYDDAASAKLFSIAPSAEVNVQSDWNETNSALDSYIANKPDVIIPQVGAGVTDVPKYIMVVTAMPPAAQIDPNTIYLVQGTYIGN